MQHFGSLEGVEYKDGTEPVTAADHACNEYVTRKLGEAFPEDGILSEEAADDPSRLARERVWIVDPLDGTKEFVAGIEEFVVMIGLSINQEARLGVVLQPSSGLLMVGIPGWGAYATQGQRYRRLGVSGQSDIGKMQVAVSRSHLSDLMKQVLDDLNVAGWIRVGGAGLKVGLMVSQDADCYIHSSIGLKEWDLCAPVAILRAAGGTATDCWGGLLRFNQTDVHARRGLIASNGTRHQDMVETVSRFCEDQGIFPDPGFTWNR